MNIQFHFKKQVKYLFALLLFVFCVASTEAQNHNWFKGSWYGAKSFPHAHIGIKVLVRIEVDSLYNNYFSGRLIYMYPKDTIARLIRTFKGKIHSDSISINKGQELYLLDARSRSFWSNCSQCNETGLFLLSDSDLVFKITTTGCGDSCDAETVFSKNITTYDSVAKADIQKMFSPNKETVAISGINSKQKNNKVNAVKQNPIDSGKNNINAIVVSKNSSNTNSKTDSSITTANINTTQKNNKANVVKQTPTDSGKNNTNATAINKNPSNTNSKADSLIATADINTTQKNNKLVVAKQSPTDSNKNNTTATVISKNLSNANSKTNSLITTANINTTQKSNKTNVAKQSPIDSNKSNATAIVISKNSSNANSKTDSLITTADINTTQKSNKTNVAKQSLIDSNKSNATAINKNPSNTNSKADSLTATANINTTQKNNKANVAKQNLIDSGKNNTNAVAINKNPSNTNSKKDSLTATVNINTTQKNNKTNVAKQSPIDSNKSNATAINKNPSNTNSKADTLSATANINTTQKNNKANVAKQNPIDSGKNNTTTISKNSSNQNNPVVKTTADTTKNHQPLSDSDANALQRLVPAKTFILADTSNQFISRTDSVAMAKLHRETNLINEYQVSDSHIEVELFDNGIIDSDAVTVYYNGRILFNNVVLTYKPIAFAIDASGANRHHEFVLIAENEGSIPPNTALLRITAGKQQFKLFVSTTLSKNAKIAIDYTGY